MNSCYWWFAFLCAFGAIPDLSSCYESGKDDTYTGRVQRNEFVRAMNQANLALGKKKNDDELRSRLVQLATPRHEHPGYQRSVMETTLDENSHRDLEDYDNENYSYAVNLTEYALKYIGCSNIKTYDDNLAAENNENDDDDVNSFLKMDRFVILRLCPRDSCSNYNNYGCMQQFGDYVIPLSIYLQVMAETYFAQYEEYCETCYECMSAAAMNNNNYNDDNANNDDYKNGDDGYYNRYRSRRLNDDYYNNYNGDDAARGDDGNNYNQNYNYANDDTGCEYYTICENYQNICQEYTNLGFELQDYFECAEFNIGNGVGYLGPHCGSDGKTISMGIYNDQYCNQYNTDLSEVSSYMSTNENELEAYFSENCISCLASDGYLIEANNNDDAYSDISEVCTTLYDESAKCNKYMGNSFNYTSGNQEAQENTVCNFISELVTNSYDEYGEIILRQNGWMTAVPAMLNTIPQWQKVALSVSIISVISMFIYACYLYRKITRRKITWYPRGRKGYSTYNPGMEPTLLDGRLHSGIIQGRSHSSGSRNFEMRDGGIIT